MASFVRRTKKWFCRETFKVTHGENSNNPQPYLLVVSDVFIITICFVYLDIPINTKSLALLVLHGTVSDSLVLLLLHVLVVFIAKVALSITKRLEETLLETLGLDVGRVSELGRKCQVDVDLSVT